MKKFLLLAGMVGLFLGVQVNAAAQAKKPTIMVVPSDAWCNQNGYMLEYDNQGRKDKVPLLQSSTRKYRPSSCYQQNQ